MRSYRPLFLPDPLTTAITAIAVVLCACSGGGPRVAASPTVESQNSVDAKPSAPSTPRALASITPAAAPSNATIAISAGHGGPNNVGAVHHDRSGVADVVEKDLNLDIARRLDALLRADGYATVMLRDCDCSVSPQGGAETPEQIRAESQARADIANAHHADVLVVIHHNGSGDPLQSGTEVYYNPDRSFGDKSRKLAYAVHDALIATFRAIPYTVNDRGVKDDAPIGQHYGQPHTYLFGEASGFRATQMPAALGEALFISNDTEAALLLRDDIRDRIAHAYRDGVEAYFRQ